MNFGAELRGTDMIGLPRFTCQQAKAIIDRVKKTGALVSEPVPGEGTGIVIAGGGRYLSWTWVLLRWLRHELKCQLPVQVWHLGPKEMPGRSVELMSQLDAECVDAHRVMLKHPVREMGGWPLKSYAVRHCPWRHVLFSDADSFPQVDPQELFNDQDVQKHGSLFFHDVGVHHDPWFFVDWGMPMETEWETGQFIMDKAKAWMALQWTLWASEHTDVFYKTAHGDKGIFHAAYRISESPVIMGDHSDWEGYGIGHYFKNRKVYSHMMATKRGEWPMEDWMKAAFEEWKTIKL